LRRGQTYPERVSELADLRWFLVFNGIADRWLGPFEADGWQLIYRDPAYGMLGILPADGGQAATIDDARRLADVAAFDHDAPVGISPAVEGVFSDAVPGDPAAAPPLQPIQPFEGPWTMSYWQWANVAYAAAAELRFNGSYVIRYDDETGRAKARVEWHEPQRRSDRLASRHGVTATAGEFSVRHPNPRRAPAWARRCIAGAQRAAAAIRQTALPRRRALGANPAACRPGS
jgi:hypothetical protein